MKNTPSLFYIKYLEFCEKDHYQAILITIVITIKRIKLMSQVYKSLEWIQVFPLFFKINVTSPSVYGKRKGMNESFILSPLEIVSIQPQTACKLKGYLHAWWCPCPSPQSP